jgi:hypothetical protein
MEVDEFAGRFEAAIAALPRPVQSRLLEILDSPEPQRAREIGKVYTDPHLIGVAELLIDLEEEPVIRKLVAAALRSQVRP